MSKHKLLNFTQAILEYYIMQRKLPQFLDNQIEIHMEQ